MFTTALNPNSTRPNGRADIARPRLIRALERCASYPITIVNAPIGSGATTLLRQFAASAPRAEYVDVRGMPESELRTLLHRAGDAETVILDHFDQGAPAAISSLLRDVASEPGVGRRVIVAAHARRSVQAQELFAHGIAATVDARDLAFTAGEIAELATALGVSFADGDVSELHHVTEGWPVAVAWILRNAAEAGGPMRGAFDVWSERRGHLLIEFLEESDALSAVARRRFSAMLRGGAREGDRDFASLEAAGFPVARTRVGFRPYRILTRLNALAAPKRAPADVEPLTMTLFGRFACTVGGKTVEFARRRDRSVLAYAALSPNARVSRADLLAAFWPGVPISVASQGLRTTLSRLRRVIAEAAGRDADHYLVLNATMVGVNVEHAQIDACRFAEHIAQGRAADRDGDLTSACEHYRSAERIYAGELLSSEAVEPALAPRVAEYAALFETTLARLVEIRVEEAGLLMSQPPSPFTLRFDSGVPAVAAARGTK